MKFWELAFIEGFLKEAAGQPKAGNPMEYQQKQKMVHPNAQSALTSHNFKSTRAPVGNQPVPPDQAMSIGFSQQSPPVGILASQVGKPTEDTTVKQDFGRYFGLL